MSTKRSGKRPYHRGEELQGELVAEAVRQVEPLGIGGLSTREVARAVGVSHAAPKHYFPDKLALGAAVAGVGFERMHAAIVAAVSEARSKSSEKLLAACGAYVEFALRNRGLYRTMYAAELAESLNDLRDAPGKGSDDFSDLAQLKAQAFSLFVEIVRDGQAQGAFRRGRSDDLARIATALAHGLSREFLDEGLGSRIDRIAHARQIFGLALTGLEAR
jgi:AcrR family transcriptional regulator